MRTEGKFAHERDGRECPRIIHRARLPPAPRKRPRPPPAGRFLDALRAELPAAIADMKTGSIAPVDMAQATIGPGMAIYSRYSAVLHADGAKAMSVREALSEINRALDEVLEEQDAHLDPETRFAIDWFTQYGHQAREFGGADVLARAKGTAVESVQLAGLVESVGGQVRIINWREYDPGAYDPEQDKRPTVWEGTHHLIERLNSHGEMGAAALYNLLPGDIAESVRDSGVPALSYLRPQGLGGGCAGLQHAGQQLVGDHAAGCE